MARRLDRGTRRVSMVRLACRLAASTIMRKLCGCSWSCPVPACVPSMRSARRAAPRDRREEAHLPARSGSCAVALAPGAQGPAGAARRIMALPVPDLAASLCTNKEKQPGQVLCNSRMAGRHAPASVPTAPHAAGPLRRRHFSTRPSCDAAAAGAVAPRRQPAHRGEAVFHLFPVRACPVEERRASLHVALRAFSRRRRRCGRGQEVKSRGTTAAATRRDGSCRDAMRCPAETVPATLQ